MQIMGRESASLSKLFLCNRRVLSAVCISDTYLTVYLILKSTDRVIFILFSDLVCMPILKHGAFTEKFRYVVQSEIFVSSILELYTVDMFISFPKCAWSSWWDLF